MSNVGSNRSVRGNHGNNMQSPSARKKCYIRTAYYYYYNRLNMNKHKNIFMFYWMDEKRLYYVYIALSRI